MNLQEFKAWFEGYTEALVGVPDEKQWKRIKERVAKIDGSFTPQHIFLDRYVQPFYPMYPHKTWYSGYGGIGVLCTNQTGQNKNSEGFNSLSAFNDLGKLEASN